MNTVQIIWAVLVLASTAGGLLLASVGSRLSHVGMATGGVLACIGVSSYATALLLVSDAIGMG